LTPCTSAAKCGKKKECRGERKVYFIDDSEKKRRERAFLRENLKKKSVDSSVKQRRQPRESINSRQNLDIREEKTGSKKRVEKPSEGRKVVSLRKVKAASLQRKKQKIPLLLEGHTVFLTKRVSPPKSDEKEAAGEERGSGGAGGGGEEK